MLVTSFPAPALGTNCYILAGGVGQECVIVDPGGGVTDWVWQTVSRHELRPRLVVATHGHLDHTYSAPQICERYGIPVAIHERDEYRLADPLGDLDPMLVMMIEQQSGQRLQWRVPDSVQQLRDGQELSVAGLRMEVTHVPGHTQGSVVLTVADVPDGEVVEVDPSGGTASVFSGDTLFCQGIGRTDLPGGDPAAMQQSLVRIAQLPSDYLVFPGHGPGTSIGRERHANPYLRSSASIG